MGNDWTRLTQEAKVLGGLDGLRDHYTSEGRNEGRIEAAAVGAALLLVVAGIGWCINKGRKYFSKMKMDMKITELESKETLDIVDQSCGREEQNMSKKRLTKAQQEGIVVDLACGMETMGEEEFDDLYNQLDIEYQMEVDKSIREFADNAIGDEHWDSDN